MTLSTYHQKYVSQSDVELQKKVKEKRLELFTIFKQIPLKSSSAAIKIAVLGCGDKRFIKQHEDIFKELIKKPIKIITFDITTDHLNVLNNILQHDCTLPLPMSPFDITYAHVLLKFIKTEKQWSVIINSIDALKPVGLAIHILDREDYETKEPRLANNLYSVPLNRWKIKLDKLGIVYKEIPIKYGLAFVIVKK